MHESVRLAARIRLKILEALHASGGGHYGGALSIVELLLALYQSRTIEPRTELSDFLILSKGHGVIAQYALLVELGIAELPLEAYGTFGSGLEGHPDMLNCQYVHFTSGSLGQGIGVGLGMALANSDTRHVWVIVGDGECQEGQIWESAMLASRYATANLHVIVDNNGAQECGWAHASDLPQAPLQNADAKWTAFGWGVEECDGHDVDAVSSWITRCTSGSKGPTILIAHTAKGRGVTAFEQFPEKYHCAVLSDSEFNEAQRELRLQCA